MLEQAKAKLTAEMNDNLNNPYIHIVGGHLLQYLDADPGAAEKILTADKTIAKSLDAMRKEAEKKKVGNCAVLTDAEGFGMVMKYFGIDSKPGAFVTEQAQNVIEAPKIITRDADFDIKLEDLL